MNKIDYKFIDISKYYLSRTAMVFSPSIAKMINHIEFTRLNTEYTLRKLIQQFACKNIPDYAESNIKKNIINIAMMELMCQDVTLERQTNDKAEEIYKNISLNNFFTVQNCINILDKVRITTYKELKSQNDLWLSEKNKVKAFGNIQNIEIWKNFCIEEINIRNKINETLIGI